MLRSLGVRDKFIIQTRLETCVWEGSIASTRLDGNDNWNGHPEQSSKKPRSSPVKNGPLVAKIPTAVEFFS